jgi:hypothetical protein
VLEVPVEAVLVFFGFVVVVAAAVVIGFKAPVFCAVVMSMFLQAANARQALRSGLELITTPLELRDSQVAA